MRDSETGKSRHFGFVYYTFIQSAKTAISKGCHQIGNHVLRTRQAISKYTMDIANQEKRNVEDPQLKGENLALCGRPLIRREEPGSSTLPTPTNSSINNYYNNYRFNICSTRGSDLSRKYFNKTLVPLHGTATEEGSNSYTSRSSPFKPRLSEVASLLSQPEEDIS